MYLFICFHPQHFAALVNCANCAAVKDVYIFVRSILVTMAFHQRGIATMKFKTYYYAFLGKVRLNKS